jgi:hypothetical protein
LPKLPLNRIRSICCGIVRSIDIAAYVGILDGIFSVIFESIFEKPFVGISKGIIVGILESSLWAFSVA